MRLRPLMKVCKICFRNYYDDSLSEKENVANITKILRERIIELKGKLDGQEA